MKIENKKWKINRKRKKRKRGLPGRSSLASQPRSWPKCSPIPSSVQPNPNQIKFQCKKNERSQATSSSSRPKWWRAAHLLIIVRITNKPRARLDVSSKAPSPSSSYPRQHSHPEITDIVVRIPAIAASEMTSPVSSCPIKAMGSSTVKP
jgi:hypothetical protein